MSNDNMDFSDPNEFDESLFEEEDLMTSLAPGPRIFTLANEKVTTLLGFVLSETPDSFLIALPSRLMEIDGKKQIQAFVEAPYCRMLKTAVSMVIPIFGEFKEFFDEYLDKHGAERYPAISEEIEVYLASAPLSESEPVLSEEEIQSREKDREDLANKLAEADAMGAVISELSPTKH